MARRWIVRLALIALVAGAVWRLRAARTPAPKPVPPVAPPAPTPVPAPAPVDPPPTGWREPVDGACPEGFPVKVNTRSGIAHEPGGRFYERTVPDRCYATAAEAEADGYRRAKA